MKEKQVPQLDEKNYTWTKKVRPFLEGLVKGSPRLNVALEGLRGGNLSESEEYEYAKKIASKYPEHAFSAFNSIRSERSQIALAEALTDMREAYAILNLANYRGNRRPDIESHTCIRAQEQFLRLKSSHRSIRLPTKFLKTLNLNNLE